jgi:antitoxin HicB
MLYKQTSRNSLDSSNGGDMQGYPVNLRKDGKYFLVTFPDIPEAITQGDNREHALEMAKEALESAMDFYFEDRRPVPTPSRPKRGQAVVELPPSVAAKVLLLNEMLRQGVRPAELARRIGTTPQEVNRLTNIRHTSRIDGIDAALRALGKRLLLDVA